MKIRKRLIFLMLVVFVIVSRAQFRTSSVYEPFAENIQYVGEIPNNTNTNSVSPTQFYGPFDGSSRGNAVVYSYDAGSDNSSGSGTVTASKTANDGTVVTVTLSYTYVKHGVGNITITYSYKGRTVTMDKNVLGSMWDWIKDGFNTAKTIDDIMQGIANDLVDEEVKDHNAHGSPVGDCVWLLIICAMFYALVKTITITKNRK